MGVAELPSKHALQMCDMFNYQERDPRVIAALGRLFPITWETANPVHVDNVGDIRVIDNFIAVVDGRIDLQKAFRQARSLIEMPTFKAAVILRDQDTLAKSIDRIKSTFFEYTFGASLQEGTVITWPQKNKFLLEKPTPLTSISRATFQHNSCQFWRAPYVIGKDLTDIFVASRLEGAFPEFLSWNILNRRQTSDAGLMHFDKKIGQPHPKRLPIKLKRAFLKAVLEEKFGTLLEGSVAMTASLCGHGTILTSSHGKNTPKINFMDAHNKIGFQVMDGSVMIARGNGWPDDPQTGLPRDPVYHFSPFVNIYGRGGNHKGRVMADSSACKNYSAPQLYAHHGWDTAMSLLEV